MHSNNWGSLAWYFIHITSLTFEDNLKNDYIEFYKTFKELIPCPKCKEHFENNLSKDEFNIENNINKLSIFDWSVRLHNEVNKTKNKPLLTSDEAIKLYTYDNGNPIIIPRLINKFILQFFSLNIYDNDIDKNIVVNFLKNISKIYPNINKRIILTKLSKKCPYKHKKLLKWLITFLIISDSNI